MKRKVKCTIHVIRGGSWRLGDPDNLAASRRRGDVPMNRGGNLGFRLMRKS